METIKANVYGKELNLPAYNTLQCVKYKEGYELKVGVFYGYDLHNDYAAVIFHGANPKWIPCTEVFDCTSEEGAEHEAWLKTQPKYMISLTNPCISGTTIAKGKEQLKKAYGFDLKVN